MDPAEFCLTNHLSGDASPTLRFCKYCRKAMCENCYDNHKSVCDLCYRHLQSTNRDTVVQFTTMPSSQTTADNVIPQDTLQSLPDRSVPEIIGMEIGEPSEISVYSQCTVHSLIMNQFCSSHCSVICKRCRCENHQDCSVKLVEQAYLDLDITSVSEFRKSLNKIRVDAIEVKNHLSKNVTSIEKQRQSMLKDLKNAHENVLNQLKREFENTKSEIERQQEKHTSELVANLCHINGILSSIDLSLKDSKILECRNMDVCLFLKFQEILCRNTLLPNDIQDRYNKIRKIKIAFRGNKRYQPLMAKSRIGNINVTTTKYTSLNPHQEINCPIFVSQPVCIGGSKPETAPTISCLENVESENHRSVAVVCNQSYHDVKVARAGELSTRCDDDGTSYWINGIAVTGDGRILVYDYYQKKVKMFTVDKKRILQLLLNEYCYDITVLNVTTAVVTGADTLYFIDISGTSLSLKNTVNVDYDVAPIQACGNNLLVSCWTCPQSVKLITVTGEVLWSVSNDQQGRELFGMPEYITCYRDQSHCRVVVTDFRKNIITVLDGDTGGVVNVIEVKGKEPTGVTADSNGNFYVCYDSNEIVVWNRDMSSSRVLFTTRDVLRALGYDAFRNQLIVSVFHCDTLECYQLS